MVFATKKTLGPGSLAVRADVSNLADLDAMFATIKRELGPKTTALKSNDALWRNGSCSAIVLTATTGNCRARWAVEATGNEYHPWPLRCQPFYRAARPRTGEGGLNGAPIPDEKSYRLEGSSKKNRQ